MVVRRSAPCPSPFANCPSPPATSARVGFACGSTKGGAVRQCSSCTGISGAGSVWEDVFPLLARNLRVIVPDLPGFGESEKPSPARYAYGLEAFVESLVDLVATLGVGRVSVCGHSMGGAVALMLAAHHPDLVEKLILVDPIVYGSRRGHRGIDRDAADPRAAPVQADVRTRRCSAGSSGRTCTRKRKACPSIASSECSPRSTRRRRARPPTRRCWRRSTPARSWPAFRASPRRRSSPGEGAIESVPVEHGRRLARELRRARFEVFDCGHSPPEETPDAFAEVASAFLRGKASP